MLTRRGFAGFASCAVCGLTGFIATDASAQGAPTGTTTPGVTRKILLQMDGPAPGYVTVNVEAEIEPGAAIARHTHPGIESGYVLEGGLDLPVQGQPTRTLKVGDGFQVPPETTHAGGKNGDKKSTRRDRQEERLFAPASSYMILLGENEQPNLANGDTDADIVF